MMVVVFVMVMFVMVMDMNMMAVIIRRKSIILTHFISFTLSTSPPAESDAMTVLDQPAVEDTTGTMDADLEVVVDTFEVVDTTVAVFDDVGISTMTYAVLMTIFDSQEYKMIDTMSSSHLG